MAICFEVTIKIWNGSILHIILTHLRLTIYLFHIVMRYAPMTSTCLIHAITSNLQLHMLRISFNFTDVPVLYLLDWRIQRIETHRYIFKVFKVTVKCLSQNDCVNQITLLCMFALFLFIYLQHLLSTQEVLQFQHNRSVHNQMLLQLK